MAEASKPAVAPVKPATPAPAPVAAVKPPVARRALPEIITTWAADLTPHNAPRPQDRGPLSWVRQDKVPELLELLAKEGYK